MEEINRTNNNSMNKIRLTEAMKRFEKKFRYNELNLVNAPVCSGKTTFILDEFLNNTNEYVEADGDKDIIPYTKKLSKVLYLCDTNMLQQCVMEDNKEITKKFGKGSIIEARNASYLMNLTLMCEILPSSKVGDG